MVFTFRNTLQTGDLQELAAVMESTGLFYDFEILVALEVLEASMEHGQASGYYCLVVEQDNHCVGYAVFGPTPCTRSGWDIYWMAVSKDLQGKGLGSEMMSWVEKNIALQGGTQIWIETSGRKDYEPTRGFYNKHGYEIMAELPEFYAPGDSKVIYRKKVYICNKD
ncbi:MAG TPA: GNAT family N-acetyltransferase [Bacteroidales bacterium]|nr:MAG: putative acetyltransferase [Bacteroidetes bacterium ADurb.Bin139]HOG25433.1 GNAT family N-acetyltransferase [Bacteroidales bacterium]HOR11967.1 GNAT family N-acetyltransferase [Bacteroidales bacterium]HOZ19698.1 GNAT family N-acetyltransferase [Bacteroidales bacterium]HPB77709.1 GNAT family N-acetyltransferase [Bacteroidales bacterium]